MRHFTRPSFLAIPAISLVALTGCSANGDTSAPTATVTQTVTASPAAEEVTSTSPASAEATSASPEATPASADNSTSSRGALIKQPGELAGILNQDGGSVVEFTIKDIDKEFTCTEPDPEAPENGTIIALDADLEVFPGAGDQYVDGHILNPGRFRFVGEDGKTFSGDLSTFPTFACIPIAEQLNTDIGEGEKSSGLILLDVPEAAGVLLLEEGMNGLKWEWEL